MLFNTHFILASSSSSRYKILKNNNLYFARIKPRCNEGVLKKKLIKIKSTPRKISLELARLKSKSISTKKTSELIVGSDTVISFRGNLINKAKNIIEAKTKILELSGKSHDIYSSASVFFNQKEIWKSTQKSTITIRELTEKEVDNYLSVVGKQILNSVGCYHIESLGPNIIEDAKGDYFNIMGFPLFPFLQFLREYKAEDL